MIASIAFRNFKALRNTRLALTPVNVVIGPNGSGKTSLIEAIVRLRTLAGAAVHEEAIAQREGAPSMEFTFAPPFDGMQVQLGCVVEHGCDTLRVVGGLAGWPALRDQLARIRSYVLDHTAMANPVSRADAEPLRPNGSNLAAVLARMRRESPDTFTALTREMLRIMPEFQSLELVEHADGRVEFSLRLVENGLVNAGELSQGMLYLLAVLTLAFDPDPPSVLCIEEVDRGIHPRMLREVRDLLYRLAYPKEFALARPAVQVIATTHSPYLIDLFREHPEEIVISHKHGRAAVFTRLSDRPDLPELLREGSLGDMWFSGILGGVPDEE